LLQMRVPLKQIEEHEEEIRERANESAVAQIKRVVVLNEICEAEGIEVTEDDFDEEAATLAARTGIESSTVADFIRSDERRSSYENRILLAKAMKVVMDNANVTNKEVPRDELSEDSDGDEEDK